MRHDSNFKSVFTEGLNQYFMGKQKRSTILGQQYEKFMDATNTAADAGAGSALIKLHDDVVARISQVT